jgi:hypothetical protein
VNQLSVRRSSRVSCVLGAAILLLAAVPAKAANLVEVRIGLHQEYTRVVLETDAKASWEIESSGSDELVLHLNAASEARVVASAKSTHLTSVAVKPAPAGDSEIRIALLGPVDVKQMVLSAPPRIVLDLREAQEVDAMAPAAGPPAVTAISELPSAELPAPKPEPLIELPSAELPAPKPEPPTELPSEAPPAEPVDEGAEAPEREETGAVPSIPEPDPSAVLAGRGALRKPPPEARKPSNLPSRAVVPPPPVAEKGLLDSLPAPFDQPLVLAAVAAALILVITFAVVRRRGAAAEPEPITPFAAGEPFSVDEKPGAAEETEGTEEDEDLPVGSGRPGEESSLFDQPVETVEPLGEQQWEGGEPAADQEAVAAAAPAVEPVPGPGPSQDLERRLAKLEERLEEVGDEKDRLGRQVAAQTEELRVQRAAIARTQRVLRDLTRPADEATEPVPKT